MFACIFCDLKLEILEPSRGFQGPNQRSRTFQSQSTPKSEWDLSVVMPAMGGGGDGGSGRGGGWWHQQSQ